MKIRVVSDGKSLVNTRVYDATTGEEMKNVVGLSFIGGVKEGISCFVTLTPDYIDLTTEADVAQGTG